MRAYRNKSQLLIIFLVVGFFIGIIYENLISTTSVVTTEVFSKSGLERYLQTNIIAEKYLWYVVKSRILILIIVCVGGFVKWKKLYVGLVMGITGFLSGVLVVSAVLQLGIKGILLFILGMLPHGLFYGMACWILLIYWYDYPRRQWNRMKLIFTVLMFLVGIILETYVNPMLVRFAIRML